MGPSTEVWQQKDNTKATKKMYDKRLILQATYSLVEDKARVYKVALGMICKLVKPWAKEILIGK